MLNVHVLLVLRWIVIALAVFADGIVATRVTRETSLHSSYDGCTQKNCSGYSLDHLLRAQLTNNGQINITTDVELSSNVLIKDLKGISIVGYNNPTVLCSSGGGLHFLSCHDVAIEGIIWDGCGDQIVNPVIQLHNSSNITIRKCSFQHLIGQAVVLSEVSGTVYIGSCKFLNNSRYEGDGTAIHFPASETKHLAS